MIKKFFKKLGRAVRRTLKFFFRVVVFLFLLGVFGVATSILVIQYMVSPDALKTIITAQLQETFHRPVTIQDVNFNFYQGIRVKGLQIQETAEFSGGNVLSSDYLVAKYDWKELLHKKLDLQQITMVAPRIQLVRSQDGRWNWEDILTSSATLRGEDETQQFPLPVQLYAHVISIEHGVVTVKDLRRDRNYALESVDLSVRDFDVEKPFAVIADFDNVQDYGSRKVHSRVDLKGSVSLGGLHLDQAMFRAEDIAVHTGGKTARARLTIKDFQHPSIEAVLHLPAVDSEFLDQYHEVPDGIQIPASRWRARISFPAEGRLEMDSLTGIAEDWKLQANGSLGLAKDSKPFHVSWNIPPTPLADLTATWSGLEKYALSGRAAFSGDIVGDLVDLDHTLAVQQTSINLQDFGGVFFKDQKLAHVDAALSGSRNFETLSVAASRGSWTTFGNLLTQLDFSAQVAKGDLMVDRFNGTWGISHFKLFGEIAHLSAPKDVRVDGTIDKLDLDKGITAFLDLLEQLKKRHPKSESESRVRRMWSQIFKYSIPKTFPATSGQIKVAEIFYPAFRGSDFDGQWDLRGISTGLKQSNGNMRFSLGGGRVTDIETLENQDPHNILRVMFLPFSVLHEMERRAEFSAATAIPRSFDFSRIYGDYGVRQGVVDFRNFYIQSGIFLAHTEGKVDFPQEKVDLHILTRMNKSTGILPQALSDQCGRPAVSFFVQDNLNDPTPRKEYVQMACDAIEKAIAQGMQRGKSIFTTKGGRRKT